jgi:hypothetical protein
MESLLAVENTNNPNLVETGFTSCENDKLIEASTSKKTKTEKPRELNIRNEERDSGCSGSNRKVSVLRQNKVSASKFIAREGQNSDNESPYFEIVKGKKVNNNYKSEAGYSKNKK